MKKAIFWFRQDLRVYDNRGLIDCIEQNDLVLPIFILDKNLVDWFWWLTDKKFGFLREMLEKLDKDLKQLAWVWLKIFFDTPNNTILHLMWKYDIKYLYANISYSIYWKKRDLEISQNLEELWKIAVFYHDFLLLEPFEIEQRKVFTPYFKKWIQQIWDTRELKPKKFKQLEIEENSKISDFIKLEKHPYFTYLFWLERLNNHIKNDYSLYRNDLDKDATSKISPYLRFGVFSIRQIYNISKNNQVFVSELAWREFWQHIAYYFPETKKQEFQENKRHIKWHYDDYLFEKWTKWETGYPIVDAAMKHF